MNVATNDTPRLTEHARQRCAEMGVGTKRAKRVVRSPDVCYPGTHQGELVCYRDDDSIACAFVETDGRRVILTVLWKGVEFVRPPAPSSRLSVSTKSR